VLELDPGGDETAKGDGAWDLKDDDRGERDDVDVCDGNCPVGTALSLSGVAVASFVPKATRPS
jgi:hypothetical protein